MITTQQYQYRVNNYDALNKLTLPNAFKVYIQCRQVVDSTTTGITSFENSSTKIFINSNTLLTLYIHDYNNLVDDTSLDTLISDTLSEHNAQMKTIFIAKI